MARCQRKQTSVWRWSRGVFAAACGIKAKFLKEIAWSLESWSGHSREKNPYYYVVQLRDRDKVRTDIVHVDNIKPQYEREQDQMPQKGDAAVRLQALDPEEQVEIPDVVHESDLKLSQTSNEKHTKASSEDDSEDEAVPELAAPALKPKFSSRDRRLPPPPARYGD